MGLGEAFCGQSLFGEQGMRQCACRAITKQCTLKGANAKRLKCCVPAAATCRNSMHEQINGDAYNCIFFIK